MHTNAFKHVGDGRLGLKRKLYRVFTKRAENFVGLKRIGGHLERSGVKYGLNKKGDVDSSQRPAQPESLRAAPKAPSNRSKLSSNNSNESNRTRMNTV